MDNYLSALIPDDMKQLIIDIFESREGYHFHSVKERQMKKFNSLLAMKSQQSQVSQQMYSVKNTIVNISDRQLADNETMLLQKGLNFNVTRKPLTKLEIIPVLEPVIATLPVAVANEVRLKLVNSLKKKVCQEPNLNKDEKDAIRNLRKDKSIYITKADKGNVIVVMKKEDYEKKVLEHLSEGPYERIVPRSEKNSFKQKHE